MKDTTGKEGLKNATDAHEKLTLHNIDKLRTLSYTKVMRTHPVIEESWKHFRTYTKGKRIANLTNP